MKLNRAIGTLSSGYQLFMVSFGIFFYEFCSTSSVGKKMMLTGFLIGLVACVIARPLCSMGMYRLWMKIARKS